MSDTHERYRTSDAVKPGSERMFGLVFAAAFIIVALFPLLDAGAIRLWALGAAAAFLMPALLVPRLLKPLNLVWFRFGMLLHAIVGPAVLAVLFFATVTPTALVMRALGKDPLRLRRNAAAASYWIVRAPPGPPPASMKNQF